MKKLKDEFCWWCSKPIKIRADAPADYKAYCDPKCLQLDWMFRKWQNDKFLNYLIWKVKDE